MISREAALRLLRTDWRTPSELAREIVGVFAPDVLRKAERSAPSAAAGPAPDSPRRPRETPAPAAQSPGPPQVARVVRVSADLPLPPSPSFQPAADSLARRQPSPINPPAPPASRPAPAAQPRYDPPPPARPATAKAASGRPPFQLPAAGNTRVGDHGGAGAVDLSPRQATEPFPKFGSAFQGPPAPAPAPDQLSDLKPAPTDPPPPIRRTAPDPVDQAGYKMRPFDYAPGHYGSSGGDSVLFGKVLSGSGDTYQVQLYDDPGKGPKVDDQGSPMQVEVKVWVIAPMAKLPPGSPLFPIVQVESGDYWTQTPIWLGGFSQNS